MAHTWNVTIQLFDADDISAIGHGDVHLVR